MAAIKRQVKVINDREANGTPDVPHSLFELLQEVGLGEEYHFVFESHGVKSIDDFCKVTEEDLKTYGVPNSDFFILKSRIERAQDLQAQI